MVGAALGAGVKGRDRVRQRWHQFKREIAGGGQPIEQRFLRKAVHLDQPVNDGARATEREGAVRVRA